MSLRDLKLECSYETDGYNLVDEFYIPVLREAVRYDRISGFFSSTSLALAARGMEGLIKNTTEIPNQTCAMRLVTCPMLSMDDVNAIQENAEKTQDILSQKLMIEIQSIEEEFQRDHVAALGWMIASGLLEIKIALVTKKNGVFYTKEEIENSIMHQKVGLVYDAEGNAISFSGSNNESASGWLENIEEFKVFKQWEDGQKSYFESDESKFKHFWNNTRIGARVIGLPEAVKKQLIQIGKDFDTEKLLLSRYKKGKNKTDIEIAKKPVILYPYQEDAVDMWIDNEKQLLFEMATGTGKTMTAIGCLNYLLVNEKQLISVIACPQDTLSRQWKTEIDGRQVNVDYDIICDSTAPGWKKKLKLELLKVNNNATNYLFIYTTHKTCSSKDFTSILEQYASGVPKVFVGDEVHGMGSMQNRKGLLNMYKYRIGLSATPSRWFDDMGSQMIKTYFNQKSYLFSIAQALTRINPKTGKTFLVNYYYHPRFISLTEEELREYQTITQRISKLSHNKDEEIENRIEMLLFQRANIEKRAENKFGELKKILEEIKHDVSDTIIFVSPEQIDEVMRILFEHNIRGHKFTEAQSPTPSNKYGGISEREYIIKEFKSKKLDVLVAIKCLDEGIDIPQAKRAIVMASSTNPREYVQRIGRIIRQDEGKFAAEIYDLIIKPDLNSLYSEELSALESRIFNKELVRVQELSENALNNAQILAQIQKIQEEI